MNILHTSDWHLGRLLYGRPRTAEFEAFLQWLLCTIEARQVQVLLVAGDVFDTTTPTHQAQGLYYRFLHAAARAGCQHIVIIGGNHDSPTFLDAPQEILRALNVHVVGQAATPGQEVLLLRDAEGTPQLIVCAVPYLRERDVRTGTVGESIEDKANNYLLGVRQHYEAVATYAQALQQSLEQPVPIVGMGHIFTQGGRTLADDGVRDLIVGGLGHIHPQIFDQVFDYVALGHLHVPQMVGDRSWVRYSGSPLPMGFGEALQQKSVCLIRFQPAMQPHRSLFEAQVECLPIPVFQTLRRLEGDWPFIQAALLELRQYEEPVWLEIIYTGQEVIADLRLSVQELLESTEHEVLRLQNQFLLRQILQPLDEEKSLEQMTPMDMFTRCLEARQVDKAQWPALQQTYQEVLSLLAEDVD